MKTDRHNIIEILFKVTLNTITLTHLKLFEVKTSSRDDGILERKKIGYQNH